MQLTKSYLYFIKYFFYTIGIVWLMAIYACSDNSENKTVNITSIKTTSASSANDACALLQAADAEAVLEYKVTQSVNNGSMCQYLTTSEKMEHLGESVTLTLMKGAASEFEKYITGTEEALKIKSEPVTGIGNKAAWAGGSLILTHKTDMLIVMVGKNMDKTAHITVTKALAQKILARL